MCSALRSNHILLQNFCQIKIAIEGPGRKSVIFTEALKIISLTWLNALLKELNDLSNKLKLYMELISLRTYTINRRVQFCYHNNIPNNSNLLLDLQYSNNQTNKQPFKLCRKLQSSICSHTFKLLVWVWSLNGNNE